MSYRTSLFTLTTVALGVVAGPALAATQTFTASTASVAGQATFVTGSNSLTLTLENLWAGNFGATQAISGVDFRFDGLPSIASGTVQFTSGDLVRYIGGVAVNLADPAAGDPFFAWNLSFSSGTLKLSALPGGVGENGPDLTVDPDPFIYSGNNSVRTASHNDFFRGPVVFTFSGLSGVTSQSTVNDVVLRFNTTGTAVPSIPAVPEPGTYALMLAGLAAVGFVARRRRP